MKISRHFVTALASTLLVAACATVHESYAPDGRKAYTLNCSGTARGWDKCYSAAGNICSAAGYDVLDRSDEDVGFASAGGSNRSFGASAVKTNERSMLVACKVR
jgi:hypothetical protein